MNIAKGFLGYKIVKKEGSVTNGNQNLTCVRCEEDNCPKSCVRVIE